MQPAREIRFPCHCKASVQCGDRSWPATAVEISKQSVVIVQQDDPLLLPENTGVVLRLSLDGPLDWQTSARVIREARVRMPIVDSPGEVSVFQHGVALRFELGDDAHRAPLFSFLRRLEER
jgi:hypothetical protein